MNKTAIFIFFLLHISYYIKSVLGQDEYKIITFLPNNNRSSQPAIARPTEAPDSSQSIMQFTGNFSPTKTILINKSGTATKPLIVTSTGSDTIRGINLFGGGYMPAIKITGSYVILKDMVFDGFDGSKTRIMVQINGGHNNKIVNCTFSNFTKPFSEAAISITNFSSNNFIEGCKFYNLNRGPNDQYLHAVYINDNCHRNLIKDCYVDYCSGDAFKLKNNCDNNVFDGNTVRQCGGPAYFAVENQDVSCTGNIIRNSQCLGPALVSGYYNFYIRKYRGGKDNQGDNGKIWIEEGTNRFRTTPFGF